MLNTKLILIEGLLGSGKSTTAEHLGTFLQQQGIDGRWYLEEDDPHPIPCFDLKLANLTQEWIPLWHSFTERAL